MTLSFRHRNCTLDQLGGGQQRLLGQGQDLRLPLIGAIYLDSLSLEICDFDSKQFSLPVAISACRAINSGIGSGFAESMISETPESPSLYSTALMDL